MNIKHTKSWILSAAIAIGGAGLPLSSAFAAPRDRDRDEDVRLSEAPRDVRESVDRERGNRDVKHVQHVVRNGDEFYRVTFADRGGRDTVIRVSAGGKVLGEDTVRDKDENRDVRRDVVSRDDERSVKFGSLPRDVRETMDRERGNRDLKGVYEVRRDDRTFYRAIIDERNGDRVIRVGENGKVLSEEDVRDVRTAGATLRRGVDDDGDRVAYDRLPGEVKTAIAREAGSDRVGEVMRYDRRGGSVYEAEVTNGSRGRIIRVNENGRVVSETNDTAEGRSGVRFNDLPGAVKSGIASHVSERDVTRVVQITSGGHTYYRARVEPSGRDAYWITVDDAGRESRDFDRAR